MELIRGRSRSFSESDSLDSDSDSFASSSGSKIRKSKKDRMLKIKACLQCDKRKRTCDRILPTCGRCAAAGKECVYRHLLSVAEQAEIKRKGKEKREELAKRKVAESEMTLEIANRAKRASAAVSASSSSSNQIIVPPVDEMVKLETMMDEMFIASCLESFDRTIGVLFSFRSEITTSNLSLLHSTPALSMRTDSILSLVSQGMGWTDQSKMYKERAKANAFRVYEEESNEAFSAITLLAAATQGGDLVYSKFLMGQCAKKKYPNLVVDLSQAYAYFLMPYFSSFISPAARQITTQAVLTIYQRAQLRARHVRAALEAKLTLDEIATYGPWDYADFRSGFASREELDEAAAQRRLTEIQEAEEKLSTLHPEVVSSSPELASMLVERRTITTHALKCSLYYHLGDFPAAKKWASLTLGCFGTTSTVIWFFGSAIDFVHVLNASVGMRDPVLFEQAMNVMHRMAPVFPMAEKIVHAMADTRILFLGKEFLHPRFEILDEEMDATPSVVELMEETRDSKELDVWLQTETA